MKMSAKKWNNFINRVSSHYPQYILKLNCNLAHSFHISFLYFQLMIIKITLYSTIPCHNYFPCEKQWTYRHGKPQWQFLSVIGSKIFFTRHKRNHFPDVHFLEPGVSVTVYVIKTSQRTVNQHREYLWSFLAWISHTFVNKFLWKMITRNTSLTIK